MGSSSFTWNLRFGRYWKRGSDSLTWTYWQRMGSCFANFSTNKNKIICCWLNLFVACGTSKVIKKGAIAQCSELNIESYEVQYRAVTSFYFKALLLQNSHTLWFDFCLLTRLYCLYKMRHKNTGEIYKLDAEQWSSCSCFIWIFYRFFKFDFVWNLNDSFRV